MKLEINKCRFKKKKKPKKKILIKINSVLWGDAQQKYHFF
jgi:hypothetical protein